MKDTEILKAAMAEANMKQIDLANQFGVNKATVSTNLRRDRMSVDVFATYLNAIGYTVYVGKMKERAFVPEWELTKED